MTTVVQRNLIDEVCEVLAKHHHPNSRFWVGSLPPDASSHPTESVRRFLINQFWRDTLSGVDLKGNGNTMGSRFCLIEDGSTEDWLRLFDTKIAKDIVHFKIGF